MTVKRLGMINDNVISPICEGCILKTLHVRSSTKTDPSRKMSQYAALFLIGKTMQFLEAIITNYVINRMLISVL